MTDKITVYEKPTCSKCREVDKILRESGEAYDKINYYVEPISESKLRELAKKMNLSPREFVRKKEEIYKQLDLANKSDDDLFAAMAKHPDLIERPIVERGAKAVLARPVENIRAIL